MTAVLVLHVAVAAVAAAIGPRLRARVFWWCALAPLGTVAWVVAEGAGVLDGSSVRESHRWVPGLGLELSFAVDALSLVMLGLIGGIGVLVMVYASQYFSGDEAGLPRFAALLVAFAGAMTGLVTADDLVAVFVFWELTSITSYGLIGFNDTSAAARASATQALVLTGGGGLALLAGLLLVRLESGAGSLSELTAAPLDGGATATAAAVLILIGAFTKSAQVPFHGWLPGAMAAPTPVSAYLHSATMVKAGVYLVARMSPVMVDVVTWRALTLTVGVVTMLWGGYRALRQDDLKLVLAYGTVSQLGMLIATFGAQTPQLYVAGVAMLVAHGLFKATLFMAVGIVDHTAHTRDIHRLDGLGRQLPVLAGASILAGASMAGVIPLFGFVAKETIIGGFLYDGSTSATVALAGIVIGSGLTAAYTLRFLYGAFGRADRFATEAPTPATPSSRHASANVDGAPDHGAVTDVDADAGASAGAYGAVVAPVERMHLPGPWFVLPTIVLSVPTILFGVVPALADGLVSPAAETLSAEAGEHHLHLWPGFVTGLYLSVAALAIGATLWVLRGPVAVVQERLAWSTDAAGLFAAGLAGTLRLAGRTTRLVQNGSLPVYLGVILLGVLLVPGVAALTEVGLPDDLVAAESPTQALLVVTVMAAAAGVAIARRRFGAVLLLGAVGFGVAGLFVVQGAPDLALTQVIVEIVVLAVYVLVLRHLPTYFTPHDWTLARSMRLVVAGVVGASVFVLALTSVSSRVAPPVDDAIVELAYPVGEGKNVVNVTLVDIRGYDTIGESVVLVVAALGVVSLVTARHRSRRSTPDQTRPEADAPVRPEDKTRVDA